MCQTRRAPKPFHEQEIISFEPATGVELWRGKCGDVSDIVDRARRTWPAWAAQPLATRMELMRRFANEVRKEADALADLIARVTAGTFDTSRAREIFAEMVASGRSAADVVGAMEIAAVGEDELRDLCRELLARNPKIVADVQGGKEQAAAGLIGQARKQNANVNPGEFRAMCLEMIRAMGR